MRKKERKTLRRALPLLFHQLPSFSCLGEYLAFGAIDLIVNVLIGTRRRPRPFLTFWDLLPPLVPVLLKYAVSIVMLPLAYSVANIKAYLSATVRLSHS